MGKAEESKAGLFASLKGLLRTIVAIARNRVELLLVELQEERWRLFEALLLAGMVLVLALTTLMVVTTAIVAFCVINHQIAPVVALGVVCLLATLACYWRLRNRLKIWVPFAATLAEIKKDKSCLDEKS
jgi:uncharacterized membrane protein YqjE